MHPVRLALLLALVALAAVVTTGCAATGAPPDAHANVPAPAEPPAPSPFVTIDEPGDTPVDARQDRLGIRAMADVAGRGNAGDLVQVSAGCDDPRCAKGVQVDATGHWTVRILLKATRSYPRVRLIAQSGAQVALSLARLQPPKERVSHRRATTGRPSHTTAPAATSAAAAPASPRPPRASHRRAWRS